MWWNFTRSREKKRTEGDRVGVKWNPIEISHCFESKRPFSRTSEDSEQRPNPFLYATGTSEKRNPKRFLRGCRREKNKELDARLSQESWAIEWERTEAPLFNVWRSCLLIPSGTRYEWRTFLLSHFFLSGCCICCVSFPPFIPFSFTSYSQHGGSASLWKIFPASVYKYMKCRVQIDSDRCCCWSNIYRRTRKRVGDGPSKHHADVQNEMNFFRLRLPFPHFLFLSVDSISRDLSQFHRVIYPSVFTGGNGRHIGNYKTRIMVNIKVKETLESIGRHSSTGLKWKVKYATLLLAHCFLISTDEEPNKRENRTCCAVHFCQL